MEEKFRKMLRSAMTQHGQSIEARWTSRASKQSPELCNNRINEEILRTSWLLASGYANWKTVVFPFNSGRENT